MRRPHIRALPVVAGLLMVSGFALMIGSLRIESTRVTDTTADSAAVVPTVAAPLLTTARPAPSEKRATRLYARAQAAERSLAYSGVKLVSHWSGGTRSTAVVDVQHVPGTGTYVTPADATGGPTGAATPATRSLSVEPVSSDEAAMLGALMSNYRLVSGGTAAVAGRQADEVEALRVNSSVAAAFWVDRATGLVLRRDLIDPAGRTLESTAYMRLDVGASVTPTASATPSAVQTPTAAAAAVAQVWAPVGDDGIDALRSRGWPIPHELDGGLALYQVREQVGADGPVFQLGYTDGLVAISVFLQRGELDSSAMSAYAPLTVAGGEVWSRRSGSTPFYVWQTAAAQANADAPGGGAMDTRDIVVSATTDSPSAPVAAVVLALPAQPPGDPGVADRVSRGVDRVTSWFDPLS